MSNQDLIDDLRSRINPAYADHPGTESYERRICADAIEAQADEIECLRQAARNVKEMSAMQEMQKVLKPATDENDSPVLQREYDRLKKIEAMVMACDGIDMGSHYEVPTEAWDALTAAAWDDMA